MCNFATQLKFLLGYDDALDVIIIFFFFFQLLLWTKPIFEQIFATHAIGGVVGNILTGIFAQSSVAGFDGIAKIPGGWLDHHYVQLGIQLADSTAGMGYSFVMTVSFSFFSSFER